MLMHGQLSSETLMLPQFQRAQVRKFCASSDKELYTFKETPQQRSQLHRHLLFDDHKRTIFCFVEKAGELIFSFLLLSSNLHAVGCTNMKRLMFVSAGQLLPSTAQDEWVDLKLLEKGKVAVVDPLLTQDY